ncbi:MAG: ligase-associated DNA damage response endonuclease PdeM [Chloroflexota bacterium]|nr:ligase-associated DNA damage response endonuclease PdeM [Chloroflexota bacterium]
MTDYTLEIYDETLILLLERAIYWPRTGTLLIADLHLGKSATLRAHAIPVPAGDTAADLQRLSQALSRTGARQLIILGDLLHAARGRDATVLATFQTWRDEHADLRIRLVRGNHDRSAGDPPEDWRIQTVNGPTPGPRFVLNHEPIEPETGYALTGHLHPAVQLTGKGRQALKLPCFWFGRKCAVLPAFGEFTAGALVKPALGDRVFVVANGHIMAV